METRIVKLTKKEKEKHLGNVIGAKIIKNNDDEKIIIAIREGANRIIKIIDSLDDAIEKVLEKGMPLYHQIQAFFDDVFNYLPTEIHKGTKIYKLTLQPSRGKEIDHAFYIHLLDGKFEKLVSTEAKTMFKAKSLMQDELEKLGYL